MEMELTGLRGRWRVPVWTEQFQRDFVQEMVYGEPDKLVRALVPMEDAQASFQILRLSAVSRLSLFSAQSHPPSCNKLLQVTTPWWSVRWRPS